MKEVLDVATKPWGVKVERVEVMDVKIPENLQRAMAAEAEAARNARAQVITADEESRVFLKTFSPSFKSSIIQVIMAEGEFKASRALREASQVVSANPAAMQVRWSC